MGRGYGLVADLSVYKLSAAQLLNLTSVSLDQIVPDLTIEESGFVPEPKPYVDDLPDDSGDSSRSRPDIPESHGLIRVWRKQKHDNWYMEFPDKDNSPDTRS